ncbi:hypothetical protein ACU686_11180, partial [Yinghuangia aomiensis]
SAHAAAAPLFADLAADRARLSGPRPPQHPQRTPQARDAAGGIRAATAAAAVLFVSVAADRARVLGPDHPATPSRADTVTHGTSGSREAAHRRGGSCSRSWPRTTPGSLAPTTPVHPDIRRHARPQ